MYCFQGGWLLMVGHALAWTKSRWREHTSGVATPCDAASDTSRRLTVVILGCRCDLLESIRHLRPGMRCGAGHLTGALDCGNTHCELPRSVPTPSFCGLQMRHVVMLSCIVPNAVCVAAHKPPRCCCPCSTGAYCMGLSGSHAVMDVVIQICICACHLMVCSLAEFRIAHVPLRT